MKYIIVDAYNSFELEQVVRRKVMEGWVPQGGICACAISRHFYQAMVKPSSKMEAND